MSAAAEDDPIVSEVDVVVSGQAGNVYLFQYPLRPVDMPYHTPLDAMEVRIKPTQKKVEMKLPLDTSSSYFNPAAGYKFADDVNEALAQSDKAASAASSSAAASSSSSSAAVGGDKVEKKEPMFPSGVMDFYTLKSSSVPLHTNYAVGIMRDGRLHITPLDAILQMRPSFDHIDLATKPSPTAAQAAMQADDVKEEGSPEKDKPKAAVQVTVKRRETERSTAAKEKSWSFAQKKSSEEEWVQFAYKHDKTSLSTAAKDRICTMPEDTAGAAAAAAFPMSASQYMCQLVPPGAFVGQAGEGKGVPRARIHPSQRQLSLHDTLRLPLGDQVRTLLIQGHAVAFSTLMRLVNGGDPDVVIEVLQTCAHLIQGNWVVKSELVFPPGSRSYHSNVAAKQLARARDYLLLQMYYNRPVKRREMMEAGKIQSTDALEILKQVCRLETPRGWVLKIERDTEFCDKYQHIAQQQDLAWARFEATTRNTLQAYGAMPTPDTLIHSSDVDGGDMSDAGSVEFGQMHDGRGEGNVVLATRAVMSSKGVFGIQSLLHAVSVKTNNSSLTEEELLGHIGAITREVRLDYLPGKHFVLTSTHSDGDQYREMILSLFEKSDKIRRQDVITACAEAGLPEISQSTFTKIMKELAVNSKGSFWTLKIS